MGAEWVCYVFVEGVEEGEECGLIFGGFVSFRLLAIT